LVELESFSPRERRYGTGVRRLHEQIREAAEAGAAVNGLCRAAGVSRAGYYRFQLRAQPQESDVDLRSQIQQIALRWPAYGYRRVHAELLRQGWRVNHKSILRLMRADNLLCLRRRKFLLTTDSQHGLPIYPNLAEGIAQIADLIA
jgi:putative transposase